MVSDPISNAEDTLARFFVRNVGSDSELIRKYAPTYQEERGKPLYQNTLPVDAAGNPDLPPNAVVALVNYTCDKCHSFMAATDYPRQTPDGRPIIYIDMHDPDEKDGKEPAARDYFKKLGLGGDTGKGPSETAFGKPLTLNGKRVKLPNGKDVPQGDFPVLLNVNEKGEITGAITVGVGSTLEWWKARGGTLVEPSASKEKYNPDLPDDTTPQTNYMTLREKDPALGYLVDRAIFGEMLDKINGKFVISKETKSAHDGKEPNSREFEDDIRAKREQYSKELLDPKTRAATIEKLNKLAADAPTDGNVAREALTALITFNGVECTCGIRPTAMNVDATLRPIFSAPQPTQESAQRR